MAIAKKFHEENTKQFAESAKAKQINFVDFTIFLFADFARNSMKMGKISRRERKAVRRKRKG